MNKPTVSRPTTCPSTASFTSCFPTQLAVALRETLHAVPQWEGFAEKAGLSLE